MSYRALCIRVDAAERALQARREQAQHDWSHLEQTARDAMTPTRVLAAGFLVGLGVGAAESLAHAERAVRLAQLGVRLQALAAQIQARRHAQPHT